VCPHSRLAACIPGPDVARFAMPTVLDFTFKTCSGFTHGCPAKSALPPLVIRDFRGIEAIEGQAAVSSTTRNFDQIRNDKALEAERILMRHHLVYQI
jgi:hypothetical protein